MKTIRVVEKSQGKGMARLIPEVWEKLISLDGGTFQQFNDRIELTTNEGKLLSIKTDSTVSEGDEVKTYMGEMDSLDGPNFMFDISKKNPGVYGIRGYYPGSFKILFKVKSSAKQNQKTFTMSERLKEIRFTSTDHIRYENGQNVSGHNKGAKRGIEIEPNISGGKGYTVTIYNQVGNHPLWGDNVQMAPKQMRVVKQEDSLVELRGFGQDPMGEPFSNYGVTVHFAGDEVEKVVLHMHDRNVDIEYLK